MTFETDRFRDTEVTLPTGHFYRARSVGGEETCHQFPGLDICFDIGYAPMSATSIGNVFITHGHSDHAGGLLRHATRRHGRGLDPSKYFIPPWLDQGFGLLVKAFDSLEMARHPTAFICMTTDVDNLAQQWITKDRYVTAFKSLHRIPTLGYTVWERRKSLRPDLVGKTGQEIAAIRKSGEEVSVTRNVPDVTFCGDTKIDIVEDRPEIAKSRVLILECTMLDDSVSVLDTRKAGHIHIDEIVERAELFRDTECLVLSHFSARYRTQEIRDILKTRLSDWLMAKTFPLLPTR